jgi:hypothetical protein
MESELSGGGERGRPGTERRAMAVGVERGVADGGRGRPAWGQQAAGAGAACGRQVAARDQTVRGAGTRDVPAGSVRVVGDRRATHGRCRGGRESGARRAGASRG